jgi:predicted SprT family Zn-dependent metalloprotease
MSVSPRVEQVARLASQLLIRYGLPDWSFSFNRRKREMGLCLYEPKLIQLSLHFVLLNDDEAIRDTILHEIAHALVGPGHGHDAIWKWKCLEVGAILERLCGEVNMPLGRWQAICAGCGMLHHRHRRPKHLVGWWCRHCGHERGRLTWHRAGRKRNRRLASAQASG